MVKVAFYIAKKGRLTDKLIAWLIGSKYSHCELIINGQNCYSASMRDGGVRYKRIEDIETSGKWDIIDLPRVNHTQLNNFFTFYQETKGSRYDFLSLVINYFSKHKQDRDNRKYYCFEFVIKSINKIYGTKIPLWQMGDQLYNIINNLSKREY